MRVHTSGAKKQRPGGTSRGDTAAACLRLLGLHLFPKALLCQMLGLEQVTEVLSLSEPCWEIGLLRAGWESQKDHTGEMDGMSYIWYFFILGDAWTQLWPSKAPTRSINCSWTYGLFK